MNTPAKIQQNISLTDIPDEIWKDIPDFEGYYMVSSFGRIRSKDRTVIDVLGDKRSYKEMGRKTPINSEGYVVCCLSKKGFNKQIQVHQLVASAFLGHKISGMNLVVNHINFDRLDNRVENLEITTQRQNANQKHMKSTSKHTGVHLRGDNGKWRASIHINGTIKNLGTFECEKEASEYYEMALSAFKKGEEIVVKKPSYSSDYKGVVFDMSRKKWIATIKISKKRNYLGRFNEEIDAHNAYQKALKQIYEI